MKKILFLVFLSVSYLTINAQTGGIPSGQTIESVLRNATKRQTSSGGVNLPVLRLVPVTATGVYTSGSSKDQLLMGLFRKMSDGSFALAVDNSLIGAGGSGTFVTLSGDVVSQVTGGSTTIQAAAVTNAKMANMTASTFKGRISTTGAPQDLTAAQVKSALAITDAEITTAGSLTIGTTTFPIGSSQFSINAAFNTTKQNAIQAKDETANVGTAGQYTKINFTGAGVAATQNGGDATQLDVTIAGGGGGSTTPQRVFQNGADIRYWVISGTPTVTFTKASGVGTIAVAGGVIELDRVQFNGTVGTDTDGSSAFTIVSPTTQSGAFIQYPLVNIINTQNGSAPSVAAHLVRNPGSTPVVTFTSATAGTSITMKTGDLSVVGTTFSIVEIF